MRLLFLADPNAIHTRRWVAAFVRRGCEVHLVGGEPVREPQPGVTYHDDLARIRSRKRRTLAAVVRMRGLVRWIRPDVLHAHYATDYAWWGALSGFHPFVVTVWGSDVYLEPLKSAPRRALIRWGLRQADLITADSLDQLRAVRELGVNRPAEVIQWGVDLARFRPDLDASDWRRTLAIPDGAFVAFSPRQLTPLYRIETILSAWPLVRRELPDAVLLLKAFGKADPAHDAHLRALIAADPDLTAGVRIVEEVPYERMAELYALADAVVSIPRSDGTPVSLLEAMACGTPVVVGNLPSVVEWVRDGETGVVLPEVTPDALAAALVGLARDAGRARRLSDAALLLIRREMDHDRWMDRMLDRYRSLLDH